MIDDRRLVMRLGYSQLSDLILAAKREVTFCSPSVQPEVAETLCEAARAGATVRVLLDPGEMSFRNGFGEASAVEKLLGAAIDVRHADGIMIGFVAADDTAYFLFPQSRALVEEGRGENAVLMDAFTLGRLMLWYFPPGSDQERASALQCIERAVVEAQIHEEQLLEDLAVSEVIIGPPPIDPAALARTRRQLEINPPLPPDLRRRISVYTNKLQFIELEFEGANFHNARIELPKDAIPVVNDELRAALQTRMKVFPEREELLHHDGFRPFFEVQDDVKRIRDEYVTYCKSRKKNVFHVERKEELLHSLEGIEQRVQELKGQLDGLVRKELVRSQRVLREELVGLYRSNPHPADQGLDEEVLIEEAKARAYEAVSRAKFPSAQTIATNMSIRYRFFDPTWDDFSDKSFLNELHEAHVIPTADVDELRKLRTAYEAARTDNG